MSNQEYHRLRSACAGDETALSIVEKLWRHELGRRRVARRIKRFENTPQSYSIR